MFRLYALFFFLLPICGYGAEEVAPDVCVPAAGPQYKIKRLLNKGNTAKVYLGYLAGKRCTQLALRITPCSCAKSDFAGLWIQKKLPSHQCILELLDIMKLSNDNILAIFPYMPGGDLSDFIEAAVKGNQVVSDRLAYQYFSRLMDAIAFLHDQGIIHRDIKPENTLVGDYLVASSSDAVLGVKTPDPAHLKLTDFGYATRFVPGQKHSRQCGTPRYESPEISHGKGAQYSETVDLWAAMVTYFVLLVQSFPFAEMDSDFYLGKISKESEYKIRMLPHMQQFFDRVFSIHATKNSDYFTAHSLMETLHEYRRLRSRHTVATSDPQPESPALPLQPGIAIPSDKQSEISSPASVGSPAASSARRASHQSPQFLHNLSQAQQSLL